MITDTKTIVIYFSVSIALRPRYSHLCARNHVSRVCKSQPPRIEMGARRIETDYRLTLSLAQALHIGHRTVHGAIVSSSFVPIRSQHSCHTRQQNIKPNNPRQDTPKFPTHLTESKVMTRDHNGICDVLETYNTPVTPLKPQRLQTISTTVSLGSREPVFPSYHGDGVEGAVDYMPRVGAARLGLADEVEEASGVASELSQLWRERLWLWLSSNCGGRHRAVAITGIIRRVYAH